MRRAFTLVEILVTISLMVFFTTIGAANFQGANQRQAVDQAAERLRQAMFQAKSNAQSGKKDCLACGAVGGVCGQGDKSLSGWQVLVGSNDFTVQGVCQGTTFGSRSETLQSKVSTVASIGSVLFRPLGQGTDLMSTASFGAKGDAIGISQTFTVSTSGEVSPIAYATLAPTNTPPVGPSATPTRTPTPTVTAASPTPTSTPAPQILTFSAVDDTRVDQATPTVNTNTTTLIRVSNYIGAGNLQDGLIKFMVSGVGSGVVTNATLKVYISNSTPNTISVYRSIPNTWNESTVTWDDAPISDVTPLAVVSWASSGVWSNIDITSLITGDGTYSLRLTELSEVNDGAEFNSSENASNPPQLQVTFNPGGAATPTPTVTPTATVAPTSTPTATPTPTTGASTRIADITFETCTSEWTCPGNDGPTSEYASAASSSTIETVAPIFGVNSVVFPGTANGEYLKRTFTSQPSSDLYVSFYLKLNALPSATASIASIYNSGTRVGTIQVGTTGILRFNNSSTLIGTGPTLSPNTKYRIGIHQKSGSGNGVLEAYLAVGDAEFGSSFASSPIQTITTDATEFRFGALVSGTPNFVVDNVRIDSGSMPGPDGVVTPTPTPTTAPTCVLSGLTSLSVTVGGSVNWTITPSVTGGSAEIDFSSDSATTASVAPQIVSGSPYTTSVNGVSTSGSPTIVRATCIVGVTAVGTGLTATVTVNPAPTATPTAAAASPTSTRTPTPTSTPVPASPTPTPYCTLTTVSAPPANLVYPGGSSTWSINATSNVTISQLEFSTNNAAAVTVVSPDNTSPYSTAVNTVGIGPATLTAQCKVGLVYVGPTVAVSVNAVTPTSTPTPTTPVATSTPTSMPTPTNTPVPLTPTPTSALLAFTASEDATLNCSTQNRSTNFGTSTTLVVDNAPNQIWFAIKFVVSGTVGKSISNAKIRLYNVGTSSGEGGRFYTIPNSWSEGSITCDSSPTPIEVNPIVSIGPATLLNTWYEINMTPYIVGDGIYSFEARSTSSDDAIWSSRQGANPPQLVLTLQ